MFDILNFYKDFNIPLAPSDHKHCRYGWIQTECPFCTGNPGYHLGFYLAGGYFCCWRCGGKSFLYALSALLKTSYSEAEQLIEPYTTYEFQQQHNLFKPANKTKLPEGTKELKKAHREYLRSRNFDPDFLIQKYGLLGTGRFGFYARRIIAPIRMYNRLVTFQTRDVTGCHNSKYLACEIKNEVIHHKHILYNMENCQKNSVIVMEGITDVWRFGDDSCCTFGIKYKTAQVKLLNQFSRIVILFDPDPQAQIQADKLAGELSNLGKEVDIYTLDKNDPAEVKNIHIIGLKKKFKII